MKHAKLETSERLQRALRVLQAAKGWVSTRTLIRQAQICAVNSVIAELRENGAVIETRATTCSKTGRRLWQYRLTREPENWNG